MLLLYVELFHVFLNFNLLHFQNKKLDCKPFNNTLVLCNLGNPFKKDIPTNILIRFDPKELEDTESMLEFRVFANSTSEEINQQDPLKLHTHVIRKAEISIKGYGKIFMLLLYLCYYL